MEIKVGHIYLERSRPYSLHTRAVSDSRPTLGPKVAQSRPKSPKVA